MENTIEIYASDITPFDDDEDFITANPAAQLDASGALEPVNEGIDSNKKPPYDSSDNFKNTAELEGGTNSIVCNCTLASGGSQERSNSCMKNLHVAGTSTVISASTAADHPIEEEVTHADESPRQRIDKLIARGNVTQTEIDELVDKFAEYFQSVRNALPTPSYSVESEKKLNTILYSIVNGVNSGVWNDYGIENFNKLCDVLHITADVTVKTSSDKKIKHYHWWKISLTDWLKIVRYVDNLKLPQSTEMSLNFTPMSDEQFNNVISGNNIISDNNTSPASSLPVREIDAAYINRNCDILVVANHYLTPAEQNTFVCPKCGSGSHGNHNTGMSIDKSRNKIHCYNCGIDWSVLDVILHCENLSDRGKEFVDALKIACNLYGLPFDDSRADFAPLPPEKKPDKRTQKEITLTVADIAESQKHIDKLPVDDQRGLSLETFNHFCVGFIANWTHPQKRADDKFSVATPRLIIPTSDITYNAILLKSARTDANKKWKSLNAGPKYIFNLKAITKGKPVIVVEGEIDAMSIWQACKGDINVIALGGAAQSNLIRYFAKISADYQFIILFDNDGTGLRESQELADELIKKGYPAICKFLSDGESKLDANDILVNQGDAALKARIDEIFSAAIPELAAIKESIVQARLIPPADEKATTPVDNEDPIQKIKAQLQWARDSHGHPTHVKGTQKNLNLIFDQDPLINGLIGYDEFYEREVLLKSVEWKKNGAGTEWTDTDDAHLYCYLRDIYTEIKGKDFIRDTVIVYSRKNSFHPVKQYLESLVWDGISRAEEFFIKFLKVEDSPYSREVTLKWLLGAVARVYYPGCDFQSALVLQGNQGIGKGFSARMLGKKWHITLDDNVDDSHALDAIRSAWICEIEEMSAVRKAEINAVKSFLSRGIDTRRAAYERRERQFKRHCVFIITVNDSQFLRDHTGNRRFKILKCNNKPKEFVEGLTSEYVDQVWAEVFHRYQLLFADGFNPALLMLSRESEILSEEIAESYLMDDGMKGEIENFLATKILPSYIWELLTKEERRRFISNASIDLKLQDINLRIRTRYGKNQNAAQIQVNSVDSYIRENSNHAIAKIEPADFKKPNAPRNENGIFYRFYGTVERVATCASEIFNECFGNDKRKSMARINEILSMLEGWTLDSKRQKNFAGAYGDQKKIYSR